MKCPKYIHKALIQRAKAAEKYLKCDYIVGKWLEKNGLIDDVEEYDIYTGCESIINPFASSNRIYEAILSKDGDAT